MSDFFDRRAFERISSSIDGVSTAVSKSSDDSEKAIGKLGNDLSNAFAVQTVDLLTEDEVEELRKLISLGDGAAAYFAESSKDDRMQGMYVQLWQSGFLECVRTFDFNLILIWVTPKANWAVSRFDKAKKAREEKERAEKERRESDRKWQRRTLLIGFVTGLVAGSIAPVLASILKALASSAGIPIA